MKRRTFLQSGACVPLISSATIAWGQAAGFPTRPVRIVIPFAAGQGSDVLARGISDKLSAMWGQPVVVDNRAGANGTIAAMEVARSTPDGHTILLTSNSPMVINPNLYKKLPYQVDRDLKAVSLLSTADLALLVTPSLPVKTVPELIAYLRANPGKMNYASPGLGSTSHLSMEAFKQATGTFMVHIPYKGSAPAMTDLIAGSIQLMMDGFPSSLPHVRSGRLRALAVTGTQPSSFLPDVPTFKSLGVTGLDAGGWYGVFLPGGVDAGAAQRIHADLASVVSQPDVQARMKGLSMEPAAALSAQAFSDMVRRETSGWEKTTRALGLYQSE